MEKQEKKSTATPPSEEQSHDETFAAKDLTLSENVILTLKVLGGAGLFGGLIWALDQLAT